MSDLISRSALIELMDRYYNESYESRLMTPNHAEAFWHIEQLIAKQPTVEAIPKEKLDEIVERLEEASFVVEVDYDFDEYDDDSVECVFLNEAIEIVKGVMNERD